MNKQLRTALLAIGLCASLLCGFLSGCTAPGAPGKEDETTLTPPAEDTGLVLNLYQPHDGKASLWEALAADYKNLTGVAITVHTPENAGEAAARLKEKLEGEEGAPGIFLFTNPREYKAWKDNALPLNDTEAYMSLLDRRLALEVDGNAVGIPLGVEAFGIIYNKAILDRYFALETKDTQFGAADDIKDYKDLEALVKDLDANKEALGLNGVFAAPALKAGESTAWTTRLLSVPVGYEYENKRVDITGEGIDELKLRYGAGYKGFAELYYGYSTAAEGFETRAYADAVKEFATAKAAMILGSTDFTGLLNSTVGQTVSAGDTAFLPAYMNIEDVKSQGIAFETVEYAAINAQGAPEQREAAAAFLDWLVTSEKGKDFLATKLNFIAPYNGVSTTNLPNNPLADDAFGWLQKEGVDNAVTYSVLSPGEQFRDKVMAEGIAKYAKGESTWEQFREDLAAGWKTERAKVEENW